MGMTINANDKFPLAYLENIEANFPNNLTKEDLKYKGYKLQKQPMGRGYPSFMYDYKGLKVMDTTIPLNQAEGLKRQTLHIRFEPLTVQVRASGGRNQHSGRRR